MILPQYLVQLAKESEENRIWVESLPEIVDHIKEKWNLKLGEPYLKNASCLVVDT